MEAIRYNPVDKTLNFVKIPIPKITHPREVLVKVAYSGVCGTDIHIIKGEYPVRDGSVTLGHEFSGTVIDFGSEVKNFAKNDRVVVDPNSGCHCCKYCHSGYPNSCEKGGLYTNIGTMNDGAWASYCICSDEQVHKIPEGISLKQGALVEPLSCLMHGWDLISPINVGEKVLVIGAGIIGTFWVVNLHGRGHRNVTVMDINIFRLNHLRELDTNFNLITPQELEERQEIFDTVIDCSGVGSAIEKGFSVLGSGGKLCIFGVAAPDTKIMISPFQIVMKEIKLMGVKLNPFTFPKTIGFVQSLGDKYFSYDKLGVRIFKLNQYMEALDLLKSGKITKAVFEL